jgi:hypothetical protein
MMTAYWIEFAEILVPGLLLKLLSALPLALGAMIAIHQLRAEARRPYIRGLSGSLAASAVTIGLLWSSLFGDSLSSSSTAGLIFLFAPIYSAAALLGGYLVGVMLTRVSASNDAGGGAPRPIVARERRLIWIPVIVLAVVVFGITRYSVLNNDLSVAERASRPETLHYLLEKAVTGDTDAFGVPLFLAQNPNAPSDILEKLSKSREPQVRVFVAKNPNTPVSVVAGLRDDCTDYVRKAARERLKETRGSASVSQQIPDCGAVERKH